MTNDISYRTATEWPDDGREADTHTLLEKDKAETNADFLRLMASDYVMDGERTKEGLRKLFGAYSDIEGTEEDDYPDFRRDFNTLTYLYDMAKKSIKDGQSGEQASPGIFQAFIDLQEPGVDDIADPFAKIVLRYHLYDNRDESGITQYIQDPPKGYTEQRAYQDFVDRKVIAEAEAEEIQRASEEAAVEAANKRWGKIVLANTSHFL